MDTFFRQALQILGTMEQTSETVKVLDTLSGLNKTASFKDLASDPRFQTALQILTPLAINYKANQVIRLLEEIVKEQKRVDPSTGLRRYIS